MSRSCLGFAYSLLALSAGVLPQSAVAIVLPWYYGPYNSQIGQDFGCGTNILEPLVSAYSAYTYWPPQLANIPLAQFPSVGEVFYAKLVLGHPGCMQSAVGIELLLPGGVATAVSAANPVFCYSLVPHANNTYTLYDMAPQAGFGCPQTFSAGLEGLAVRAPNNSAGGGAWNMAVGWSMEFLIPLTSSIPLYGTQFYFRINPDVGVWDYANDYLYVNSDTIFRAPMEDNDLTLDI